MYLLLKQGVPGAVMAIHTFGADPAKWHPHLHVLATDGLFRDTQAFPISVKETRCTKCQSEMKIISFIDNPKIIKKILKYLNLWDNVFPLHQWETLGKRSLLAIHLVHLKYRTTCFCYANEKHSDEIVYVPIEDTAWDQHENPGFAG